MAEVNSNNSSSASEKPIDRDESSGSSTSKPEQDSSNSAGEERICRICFDSENESLGNLFSPCKCKGSMKYVHVACLNEWRRVSQKQESYFQCDQCHYKYHFGRTAIARIIVSEVFITITTFVVFAVLALISGFATKFLMFLYFPGVDLDEFEDGEGDNFYQYPEEIILSYLIPSKKRLWSIDLAHFVGGVIWIGFIGAIQLITAIFTGPVGFFTRLGYGGRVRFGRGNGDRFNAILLIVLLTVGVSKSFFAIYTRVRSWSKKSLTFLESTILSV